MAERRSNMPRLRPRQRYIRSVHLERDFDDHTALREYIVTEQSLSVLQRVVAGLAEGSHQRAWRLTGNYGSGKSSLALALAHILSQNTRTLPTQLRPLGKQRPPAMRKLGMLPVLLTGSRTPLAPALLRCFIGTFENLGRRGREPAFVRRARDLLTQPDKSDLDADVISLIEATMVYLHEHALASGVFLAIDELGKFLEYAILNPEKQDIYLLQQLAELSARSQSFPFVILGILHQGFGAYAARSSITRQNEWEKIAGRYEEIVHQPTLEQDLILAGIALGVQTEDLTLQQKKSCSDAVATIANIGWFGGTKPPNLPNLALGVFPVHPSTFPVLVRLFQRFGQNERSLFGFLLLDEPFGLQEFAGRPDAGASCYRIHNLYDYIKANLGHRLHHQAGSRWPLLESLVDSYVPQQDDTELVILKTVAVLNLLDSQGFLATNDALMAAWPGTGRQLTRTLQVLTTDRRVLYARGRSGGYCLWPYTSVDILECYARAESELGPIEQVTPLAKTILEARPLVARRHYIETGNLRYFRVHYVAQDELSSALTGLGADSDGHIVIALCESEAQRRSATALARNPPTQACSVLIAASPPLQPLAPSFQDARCWKWVRAHVPELGQDEFAAREVSRLVDESHDALLDTLNDLLGLRQGRRSMEIEWYLGGEIRPVETGRDFLRLLSDVCDDVYRDCPRVHNELVNRSQLSSAAAAARMRLIERIFRHPNDPFLGLDPERKPPEMSMYLSVLQHARLHRRNTRGEWGFALPPPKHDECNLRPTLGRISGLLREAKEQRVPLPAIVQGLRAPPYGVREGLILLCIATVCAIDEQQIALYEEGSFVREIAGEHFARMLKFPDQYEFQYFDTSGVRSALFHQLLRMLDPDREHDGKVNILDVVRPLLEFAGQLPQHTLRTRRLAPETRAVRQALLAAREPATLIFTDLPEACGLQPFAPVHRKQDKDRVEGFLRTLRGALDELRAAYPELLTQLRSTVTSIFDSEGRFADVRESLAQRAERALVTIHEPRLKGFCLRLADRALPEQPWLESLGSYVCAKPPKIWFDADTERFSDELLLLAERFMRAESVAFAGLERGDGQHAVRVSLTRPDGTQVDQVIATTSREQAEISEVENELVRLLDGERRSVGLAAMSRVLWRSLELTTTEKNMDNEPRKPH